MAVTLWSTTGSAPTRLQRGGGFLESQLESWIQSNSGMVADGLTWVARQPRLMDGSIPDLIGLTREGALVVAELKRGPVGISTLTQAMHYVLVLSTMDAESVMNRLILSSDDRALLSAAYDDGNVPDIGILLIGASQLPELDGATSFLASRGLEMTLQVVTFTPFTDSTGQVLLARETDDHDTGREDGRSTSIDRIRRAAQDSGVGEELDEFIRVAESLGLGVKPWPLAVTMVPPRTRGRTLLYLRPAESQRLFFGYHLDNFAELYGAAPETVTSHLGDNWVQVDPTELRARLSAFAALMRELQQAAERGVTEGSTGFASSS